MSLVAHSIWRLHNTQHTQGDTTVTFIIIFTLGYLVGGASAVFLLGLTVAARAATMARPHRPR